MDVMLDGCWCYGKNQEILALADKWLTFLSSLLPRLFFLLAVFVT